MLIIPLRLKFCRGGRCGIAADLWAGGRHGVDDASAGLPPRLVHQSQVVIPPSHTAAPQVRPCATHQFQSPRACSDAATHLMQRHAILHNIARVHNSSKPYDFIDKPRHQMALKALFRFPKIAGTLT